jgi:hypothetical protein
MAYSGKGRIIAAAMYIYKKETFGCQVDPCADATASAHEVI